MLRRFAIISLAVASMALASCASKKKGPDVPEGGAEGGTMSQEIGQGVDASGSDSGTIPGLNSVNFDYDSSTLSADARQKLAGDADWIKANAGVTVQVEGHCDNRGSVEYNLALGERRAKSVKNYLVSLGVPSKRMTIISYGEEKPLELGDSEEAYAKNRRANFVPLGK